MRTCRYEDSLTAVVNRREREEGFWGWLGFKHAMQVNSDDSWFNWVFKYTC